MQRILLILTLVGLTAAGGCRMCADPYDYCGPTYVGQCGTVCCDPNARAGSVLSPPLEPMAATETVVEGSGVPADGALEPAPQGEQVVVPSEQTSQLVPLPAPPSRNARAAGPILI